MLVTEFTVELIAKVNVVEVVTAGELNVREELTEVKVIQEGSVFAPFATRLCVTVVPPEIDQVSWYWMLMVFPSVMLWTATSVNK